MFTCEQCCHPEDAWRFMLHTSYGPCEWCGKTRVCAENVRYKDEKLDAPSKAAKARKGKR